MPSMLPHDLNLQDAAKDAKRERMRLDDSGGKVAFCSYGTPPIYGKRSSFNV